MKLVIAAPTLWLGLTALVSVASAQSITHEEGIHYQSPQNFALELRFGPYLPDIDSEFTGGQHPYKDYFGTKNRLMSQLELDWEFSRAFGSAAVGLGVGYFNESANAFLADGTGRSADKTSLLIVPISASLIYRFDYLADHKSIPLIPYGKIGLDYDIWSISDGNGSVAKDAGGQGTGRGGTWGWHAAAGLALRLDAFDQGAARQLDSESGVNHTHIFGEFGRYDISGLGQSGKLHLGDTTWVGGMMFEF